MYQKVFSSHQNDFRTNVHTKFVREGCFLMVKLMKMSTHKVISYKLHTNFSESTGIKGFQRVYLIEWE